MLDGEDYSPEECPDCRMPLVTKVCRSAAGYYLGTECDCGPYARESDYFRSREFAEAELALWNSTGTKPHARTPGFWGAS